jgi:phosphoribosyl 1,2-cyclic phosphodiesterase
MGEKSMIFCPLYSGSSGNSIFISSGDSKILIDAGLPGKKIDEALNSINVSAKELDGIFVTHEHSDHIKGVGIISRKYDVPIYANSETWSAMEKSLGNIKEHNIKIMDRRSTVEIGDMAIKSFAIPHDAICPVGYTVTNNTKIVSVATDIGVFTEEIHNNIKGSDIILLESNHDISMVKFGPYPYSLKRRILSEVGHLSNDACGEAIVNIARAGLGKRIILGHLSNTNNNPDLAYQTVLNIIEENGLKNGQDILLSMASRNNPSKAMEL